MLTLTIYIENEEGKNEMVAQFEGDTNGECEAAAEEAGYSTNDYFYTYLPEERLNM